MVEVDRSRIEEDLKGVIEGRIRCDQTFLQMYASDASIYEIMPLAVVIPAGTEDVVQCVKYAAENQIPLIPRGSASNVIGASIGAGIVLDFSTMMRRIISVDRDSVTVQPGVVIADLNQELSPHGRRFGPDPATRRVSTVGGVLGLNATGSKWLKYGSPRDKVIQMQVVLANGTVANLKSSLNSIAGADENAAHLQAKVGAILNRFEDDIEKHRPDTKINQAGYNLFDLQSNGTVDLTRLVTGSEGTLAIATEVQLQTDPQPRHRGVSLLSFHRMDLAARAAVEITKMGVAACDLIDRRLLTLACETNPEFSRIIPAEAEYMLLVESQAEDHATLLARLDHLQHRIQNRRKLAFAVSNTTQQTERELYWRLTRRIIPTLYRLRGNRRPLTFIDDIAVDPTRLPDFMKILHRTLNEFEVTASIFCHTPQGLINTRPFLDLNDQQDRLKMERLATTLFDRVVDFGGTISGAHGDGLSRSWYLERQYGELNRAFRMIKQTFDPLHILNPGKIAGPGIQALTAHVRQVAAEADATTAEPLSGSDHRSADAILETQLPWNAAEVSLASRNCNGCARCRSSLTEERMCPIFRIEPREEASPRAKANLMRGIVTGQLSAEVLATEEFREIVDLCFNCHQCRLDCPASVDIPKLMVEAKANHYRVNGLKLSDWLLTRLDRFYEIAGRMPRIANFLIRNSASRALLDRFLGIARGRKLPSFATRSFVRWAAQNRLQKNARQQSHKICYFVDAYATWNDPELGRALVNIFKHNGIDVVVPAGQGVSGMSLISQGAVGPARKIAARNVELLAEFVRQGYQIVTTEPSAALALSHEYLNLLNDPDAELVSKNTIDACSLLLQLHRDGELELDFKPLNAHVGYHLPCHQRAITDKLPALRLLKLIPGLRVELIDKGCSGMAGTWGIKSRNYLGSLRIGFGLINSVRNSPIIAGTTECSTCKIQMEQGTHKPTVHPVKILAMAYGLMPELDDLFQRRSQDLVTT